MSAEELRNRLNWQTASQSYANSSESLFFSVFEEFFENSEFSIINRPKEFKAIYVDYPLCQAELDEIYCPPEPVRYHGFIPDYAIVNNLTNKKIFIEIKRQYGWVEGKTRSAGRGNAHERLCKYFTPGILKILRKESNLTDTNILPFMIVFQGDITRDPCRVREITCWFDVYKDHFFFWRNTSNQEIILRHFVDKILLHLD